MTVTNRKDITNRNSKGKYHGYQEWYLVGNLWYKCFYNNGVDIDYAEGYCFGGGELKNKSFHI